ncbi:MAG: BatD family protein [Candidatus Pseudobacter hemicellulosilyticus]|uniref:BatD family protein n=1 Tax=Candidatus Pseudobacter hemicellulosilyticus TaxID=3121375 RepID=A0AAJ5WSS0_9BACT|nr:MAG: BatD family protein [Pseudobacter sp.]
MSIIQRSNIIVLFFLLLSAFMPDQRSEEIDINANSILRRGETAEGKLRGNLFLGGEASKKSCYVGEPLMVVFKAYTRVNSASQVVRRPSLAGFSVLEMVDDYEDKQTIERVNGQLYYTDLIRKVHLFPLQEGVFTLDEAEVESVVHFVRTDGDYPAPYDYKLTLHSAPLTITVKPLPENGQPEHFAGAVGRFGVEVFAPVKPIRAGELVKIQVVIRGSGNFSLLTPPEVAWPAGVDTADPVVRELVNKYQFPLQGTKTFEYSFAAPDTGLYTIPAIHLPYFDPETAQYHIASSQPLTIRVTPGITREELDSRKKGINEDQAGGSMPRHYYFFGTLVALIVCWVLYQLLQLQRTRRLQLQAQQLPATVAGDEPALPAVHELLLPAVRALEQEDHFRFYQALEQAFWEFAAIYLEIPPSSLNKQQLQHRLAAKGAAPEQVAGFIAVLQECEWAAYAPAGERREAGALLKEAETILLQLKFPAV